MASTWMAARAAKTLASAASASQSFERRAILNRELQGPVDDMVPADRRDARRGASPQNARAIRAISDTSQAA